MSHVLSPLAVELKSIFVRALKEHYPDRAIKFSRQRLKINRTNFAFWYAADWPEASYKEIDAALLSLHHAGYIRYGANTITLNDKLLD